MQYCQDSGKLCFSSRTEAELAARSMKSRRKGTPSIYFCDTCNTYHLTHVSYEHSKAIREMKKAGIYYNPKLIKKKPRNNMKIFIDTDTPSVNIGVTIPNPTEGTQMKLSFVSTESTHVLLTYDQASELIEAIRLQLSKMNR